MLSFTRLLGVTFLGRQRAASLNMRKEIKKEEDDDRVIEQVTRIGTEHDVHTC